MTDLKTDLENLLDDLKILSGPMSDFDKGVSYVCGIITTLLSDHRDAPLSEPIHGKVDTVPVRMEEFISTQKKLPEKSGVYPVIVDIGPGEVVFEIARFVAKKGFVDFLPSSLVTHWQPLPQPPKPRGAKHD